MFRVRLSDAAKSDLRAIYRFGVRAFGVPQADRYSAMLKAAMKMLGDFPHAGLNRFGTTPSVRIRPVGSHIIVYAVHSDEVQILRVRHASEDWTSRPTGGNP